MFATRFGCQIEVFSCKDIAFTICGFLPLLSKNTQSLKKTHTGFRCLLEDFNFDSIGCVVSLSFYSGIVDISLLISCWQKVVTA